jgi:hypothetical protein
MNIPAGLIAAVIFAFVSPVRAQEHYKVEFTIKDGSLRYSMPIDESRKAVFQTGSRGADGCGSQLVETGASIGLTAHSSDGKVVLDGVIDLTSVTGHVYVGSLCEPIIGQRRVAFSTTVELGKRTRLQDDVEAVVTKVN